MFDLNDYDYVLPENQIAKEPASPRDQSKLMVIDRKTGTLSHHRFYELPKLIAQKDRNTAFVVNNSQVLRARLKGHRLSDDGTLSGKVEFLMLEETGPNQWKGIGQSAAKQKPGLKMAFQTPSQKLLTGEIILGTQETGDGTFVMQFDQDPIASGAGELPIPHYFNRPTNSIDESSYQTVFAKHLGSAAAPTAGLHFTPELIAQLREQGVSWNEITLHVGIGTFRPIQASDIREHKMHEEVFQISKEVSETIHRRKLNGGKIVAVGTTSVRTLESAARQNPDFSSNGLPIRAGRTSIYIYPGFQFQVVDEMITNFHLPKSSLLVLVSAFAGRELVMRAYAEAIKENYRFYSYGDAMWIQ